MKNKRALKISLETNSEANDLVRIILDDLVNSEKESIWLEDVLYTYKDYSKEEFENLEFDEKELADFGYSIISRLYSYYKRNEI